MARCLYSSIAKFRVKIRRLPTGHIRDVAGWELDVPCINHVLHPAQNGGAWIVQGKLRATRAAARLPYPIRSAPPPRTGCPPCGLGRYNMHVPGGVSEDLLVNGEAQLPAATDGNSLSLDYEKFSTTSVASGALETVIRARPLLPFSLRACATPLTGSCATRIRTWSATRRGSARAMSGTGDRRDRIFMLVTQIADRFGSSVTTTYSGDAADEHYVQ